jgi:AcrR family transcriptional regulator
MQTKNSEQQGVLLEKCLAAFIRVGTLDLSLDRLASIVGTSKRMLIHYFGGRESMEARAIARLEEKLRSQFAPSAFPANSSLKSVVVKLWEQATSPQMRGVLLIIMDLSRRAWSGSARAKAFYREQQELWVKLLGSFSADRAVVAELLQLFQGAILAYLVTGDPEPGRRSLLRVFGRKTDRRWRSKQQV